MDKVENQNIDDELVDNSEVFIDFIDGVPVSSNEKSDTKANNVFVSGFSDELEDSQTPKVGEYILMINDEVIAYGDKQVVISEAKAILYGKNPSFVDVQVEDVVILKRIPLKVGIFLDE